MIKYPIYVTLDTNILDAANFDFNEKSTLQLLVNYVKKGKVKVVLSNIVVKEAEKHIAQRGVTVCSLMRKLRADALKTATDYQIKQLGLGHILDLSTDKAEIRQKGSFIMDCFYEDYDNAPWDSEEKKYVYVDTIGIREEHKANFACRIEINRAENTFEILPFKIILGGDSRKVRYEIEADSEYEYDYEQEIEDMDRESVGLNPLGDYETYLEEDIAESKMSEDIIERFNRINELHEEYEEISSTYDSLLELFLDKENIKSIIRIISSKLEEITDFPGVIDEDDISEEEISEIEKWVNSKCEDASRKMNIANLPDSIGYGDDIEILGIDDQKLFLKIYEININPSAGDKEWIDISLSDEKEIIASGTVELTVGYIEYDEDGGVADGLEDEIDYSYRSIIEQLDNFTLEQNEYMKTEKAIIEIIEGAIE